MTTTQSKTDNRAALLALAAAAKAFATAHQERDDFVIAKIGVTNMLAAKPTYVHEGTLGDDVMEALTQAHEAVQNLQRQVAKRQAVFYSAFVKAGNDFLAAFVPDFQPSDVEILPVKLSYEGDTASVEVQGVSRLRFNDDGELVACSLRATIGKLTDNFDLTFEGLAWRLTREPDDCY